MKIITSEKWILGILPLVAASCGVLSEKIKKPEQPNVIYILVDDMGYGDLSCFGQKKFTTPNIDRLAAEGITFTKFYTGSSVCAPSRASLLTGKHTGHTNVRGNMPAQLLSDTEPTIAKIMKEAGYRTAAVGKWGIGHPPPVDDPQRKGFDYFYGYINMWHAHNLYPEFLYRNGEKVLLKNKINWVNGKDPWEGHPEGTGIADVKQDYAHFLFDHEAISYIESNKDNKFFLYLAYNVPHANNEKSPDGMEVPDYYEFASTDWPSQEKGFAAMMRNLDNSVGMIMDKLKELNIDGKTMVVFCSDNGPHQEGGHKVDFFDSNGAKRGSKRDFYDGGVLTPFLVRWPNAIAAGSKSDHVAAFWDVLPTFCDITGIQKPADTDGISFLPTLLNKTEDQKKHDYLYWEFYEQGGKQAILKGNWKAIRLNVREAAEKQIFELYDLGKDPEETTNVAEMHPELVKELNELFVSARQEFSVTPLFTKDTKSVETPF